MDEIDFDWDNLRLFLAVARAGGLGPAAKLTGKSAPTLGRRMIELERGLGVELFLRKPRGYELTEEGSALYAKVKGIEASILPMAERPQSKARPLVKISAGTWVTSVLIAAIDDIIGSTPVRLRFISSEDLTDIGHREAVIGVRNHRPESVGLAGRKIGRVQFAVYATDECVSTWAHVLSKTPSAAWVKENSDSANSIEVTAPRNALDLANAGLARAVLPTFVGEAEPALTRISDHIDDLAHDQWLVSHHDDRFLPEVRSVIDRTHALLKMVCART
ncbi:MULTISPECIES: LysR family transcriptional regulator [unclassified Ruegeria]|uniref:LysR family transcriptional regulator n=1 Tax=unclassified Ruegeria TaxID=2625375 RepID=UPI001ADAACB5|nr:MULTISPECIES: LysR family transcriptional regulator [unclassified Ruegeria]MBO9410784.1 LysR family transcriptional regulator [Ruegeria sp. R8_1]MBO9414985.1 LysR family transcriptional regulator [Ruegeria sp. R8_2]